MLLQNCSRSGLAVRTGAIGVDQTTDRDKIAWLVLGNGRTNLGYAANDFMAGNDRVVGRHEFAPFVTSRMQVGVANAAEEDFNLHVALRRIAPRDCSGGQRRFFAGGGISFRFVQVGCMVKLLLAIRYRKSLLRRV